MQSWPRCKIQFPFASVSPISASSHLIASNICRALRDVYNGVIKTEHKAEWWEGARGNRPCLSIPAANMKFRGDSRLSRRRPRLSISLAELDHAQLRAASLKQLQREITARTRLPRSGSFAANGTQSAKSAERRNRRVRHVSRQQTRVRAPACLNRARLNFHALLIMQSHGDGACSRCSLAISATSLSLTNAERYREYKSSSFSERAVLRSGPSPFHPCRRDCAASFLSLSLSLSLSLCFQYLNQPCSSLDREAFPLPAAHLAAIVLLQQAVPDCHIRAR